MSCKVNYVFDIKENMSTMLARGARDGAYPEILIGFQTFF